MSSIITAVFKATVGLLVNKGRDMAAEKLKDGDVTDQRFRGLLVREIDDIKSKLDGLARKDLLASISFFKEGIELLYDVFDKAKLARREYDDVTAAIAGSKAVRLAQGMRSLKLELTGLDESACRALANAKKRFERSREKATEAFANEALDLSDRVLAIKYRVMATILETVDNPEDALVASRVCIEELHGLSAVKDCFTVELKQGFWARISKEERRAIISTVCHVNRVVYDVTLMVARRGEGLMLPCIETGEQKVDPLRDSRVFEVLHKVGMEHCCVPWSFGQEGEEEHNLKEPRGIATNGDGHFIVADNGDKTVKVFDRSGNFILKSCYQTEDAAAKLVVLYDIATDVNSNIYALVRLEETGAERDETKKWTAHVVVHNRAAGQLRKFPVKREGWDWARLTVSKNQVLVLWVRVVHVYRHDGEYVRSFGEGMLKKATDITTGPDGQVLVLDRAFSCVHVLTEDGQPQSKVNINTEKSYYYRVACHPGSGHVIVAGHERERDRLHMAISIKECEYQRTVNIDEKVDILDVRGIALSMEGRIVVAFVDQGKNGKVIIL